MSRAFLPRRSLIIATAILRSAFIYAITASLNN